MFLFTARYTKSFNQRAYDDVDRYHIIMAHQIECVKSIKDFLKDLFEDIDYSKISFHQYDADGNLITSNQKTSIECEKKDLTNEKSKDVTKKGNNSSQYELRKQK